MLSKEEIEKAKNNLWNSLDNELYNVTYSQEELEKDLRVLLNEYNYLDTMNERKQNKIAELETREQKLIDKLEEKEEKIRDERSKLGFKTYIKQEHMIREDFKLMGKQKAYREILSIVKGENK